MATKLFVYGTLGLGQPNEHVLSAIGGSWEPATVKGYLRECGWGAKMGYPGIVLDEAGEAIKGFLFSSDNLDKHWDEIDDFEGEEYKRVLVEAHRDGTCSTEAYIYVLRKN